MKASDLVKMLDKDPEYQTMQKRKDEEQRKAIKLLEIDEKELVEELRQIGYEVNSVWDFVNNNNRYNFLRQFEGRYDSAYSILVKHLKVEHVPEVREGIIRALTEKEANEVASESLLEEFYIETNPQLKWVIANALRTVLTPTQKRKYPEYKEVYRSKNGH